MIYIIEIKKYNSFSCLLTCCLIRKFFNLLAFYMYHIMGLIRLLLCTSIFNSSYLRLHTVWLLK